MSVPGRKGDVDHCVGQFCMTCDTPDRRVDAFGYCKNCKVHLCTKCYQNHKMDKRYSYHHTEKGSSFQTDDPLPKCSKHRDEIVKYICRAHEETGCVACMMSHNYCEKDCITDISSRHSSLDDYLNLEVGMQSLQRRIFECMQKMKENSLHSEKEYQIAMDGILSRKVQLVEYINELEDQLKDEAIACRKSNNDVMKKIESNLNDLENEMLNAYSLLSKLKEEKRYNMLFVQAKNVGKEMANYCERMYEISTRNLVKDLKYLPTTEEIKEHTIFGKIEEQEGKRGTFNSQEFLESRELTQINIMSETDKKTCCATGLAFLSTDQLAIADKTNKNVKIVDVSQDQIVSQIELTSSPRDITVIPPDQLAVTLRDEERIQLLSTRKGLTKAEQIVTAGKCRGIKYHDGKLIVAFDTMLRPKVEILRLNGEVIQIYQLNELGSMLLASQNA